MDTMNRNCRLLLIAWLLALAPFAAVAEGETPSLVKDDVCDPDVPNGPDCVSRIVTIGGSGGGGSSGSFTFNWNGPGRLDYGVYDHGCLNYMDEFRRLVNLNQGLIGSVPAQAASWEQAQATMRARLDEPLMRAAYDTVKEAEDKAAIPLALSDSDASLAQLFAAVEAAPDNPTRLFNFAGALNRSGMPNEALAVLARIRALGKLPDPTLEVSGSAAMDYQEGYAEMLRGNLAAAKSKFQSTIGQEPFINAAAHGLALIQAQEGSAAAATTYRNGMWRFKPKYLVVCGGAGSDDVRPPVDDMFDTSKGKDVELVDFWHPEIATELKPFFEQLGALGTTHMAMFEPLKQKMIALSDNPRFADSDDLYNAWADKMSQLINGLDEDEPYVLQAKEKLDAALEAAGKIAGENQRQVLQQVMALVGQPGNHCPTYRSIISQGIQGVRPHAERLQAEFGAYANVWYKMATGLLSNIGDPEWFEMIDVGLRAEIEATNLGMIGTIGGMYGFPADLVVECPEEFVEMFASQVPPPEAPDPCSALFGNQTLDHKIGMPGGFPGPSFNVSIGCKEIKVDGEFNLVSAKTKGGLAEFEMGARMSASFKRGQGFDMAAGVGADAKFLGQSGSARAGVFVSGDAQGLTDAGGRVNLNRVDGTKEKMDFGLMAKPSTASRGPRLKNFWSPQ
jgi:tetratricopeptide (TPR) repeat protein